ncbi:MAG: radical SAM protein [Acidobacteria bacterium]|nr:radical SAM protein [Acidobacteriota bacterium]
MNRLLLCGAVKPFGIKDEASEPLCTMELLNNQVTREQGIHSPRSNNPSFALYLMAENIHVPVTVLDFPTWEEFTKEIDSGEYTHVGISFIIPNVLKIRRMTGYIREHSPQTRILLGGHGTAIPELKNIVEYDDICHGEGISWLRRYFGEDPDSPIIHPAIPSSINAYVYGAPIPVKGGIIIPGVGCQNSCRFCATSHKFDRKYTPFLPTGLDIFKACRKSEETLGVDDFGLMDENFCKNPQRARELLDQMEEHGKAYSFATFSSAETISKLGTDFLVRLGVNFIWIGVESKANLFEKTRGIDLNRLIQDLQDHGITVLASSILFLEHHDKKTIHEDIDWAIGLKSDLTQFMGLGPSAGTQLYREYEAEGKIIHDIPYPRKHGQDEIWFRHPHFTLPETAVYLRDAFIKKYHAHGPGVLNMAHTAVKGYLRVKEETAKRERLGMQWDPDSLKYIPGLKTPPDTFMQLRLDCMRRYALRFRPILKTTLKYSPNAKAAAKCREVIELYRTAFGPMTLSERMRSIAVRILASREQRRIERDGVVMRQPPACRITYPDRSSQYSSSDHSMPTVSAEEDSTEIKIA